MFRNFIQVAGIVDNEEAEMLTNCGVNYLGFPLRLPVNKEDLSEEEAQKIISNLISPKSGVLITYLNKAEEIKELSEKLKTKIVQLHGEIALSELIKLKKTFPEIIIIKSLIVGKYSKEDLFQTVNRLTDYIDAFITDSFNISTGATGATGIVHDWNISRELVEDSEKPIILAGGLTPENVYDAIVSVKPAGVDTHTGVEDKRGRKDREKVIKFVEEAKKGFNKIRKSKDDL